MITKTGCKKWLASVLVAGLLLSFTTPALAAGDVKRGKRQYDQFCTPCHGKNGEGDGTRMKIEKFDPAPRNHTDGKVMNTRTDIQLFKTIKEGGKAMNFSHIMPQWQHIFKDDKKVWNLLAYVRSLAKDPAWTGTPIPVDPAAEKK